MTLGPITERRAAPRAPGAYTEALDRAYFHVRLAMAAREDGLASRFEAQTKLARLYTDRAAALLVGAL
jgi:hypothetical protein